MNNTKEAYERLVENDIKPSMQRLAIMQYLLTHYTHPTVEDVYKGLVPRVPTLSRTTVYNTLRMFSEKNAAQMITIDEHRVCYDGNVARHAHFYCKSCNRIIDVFDEVEFPIVQRNIAGNIVDDVQFYFKGICAECQKEATGGQMS